MNGSNLRAGEAKVPFMVGPPLTTSSGVGRAASHQLGPVARFMGRASTPSKRLPSEKRTVPPDVVITPDQLVGGARWPAMKPVATLLATACTRPLPLLAVNCTVDVTVKERIAPTVLAVTVFETLKPDVVGTRPNTEAEGTTLPEAEDEVLTVNDAVVCFLHSTIKLEKSKSYFSKPSGASCAFRL